jgi:hypothetical protein
MRKRILIVVTGAILCAGGFACAQNPQTEILKVDPGLANKIGRQASGQLTLFGVSFQLDGVLLRADRAVVNDREVTLEGNVRMTLPPPK